MGHGRPKSGTNDIHRQSQQSRDGNRPRHSNYTEMQAGAYGIQKYRYERTAVEAGIRLDRQETRAGGYDWTGNYYGETENSVISRMAWAGTTDFQNTGSLHPTSH